VPQPANEPGFLKHGRSTLKIEVPQLARALPQSQARCEDRPCTGAANQMEVVRYTSNASVLLQGILNADKDLRRNDPANPSAVNR